MSQKEDFISRKAAIDAIKRAIWDKHTAKDAIDAVCNIPSEQSKLIQCKDCKYYEIYQLKRDGTEDRRYRPSYCGILSYNTRPDWFCADGERREDETD